MNKLFAFKSQKFNPNKPENVPDEWAWLRLEIEPQEKAQYESDNFIVLDTDTYQEYLINKNVETSLRVIDLVHPQFKVLHPSKIDFRRHLLDGIYLQKNVIMLPNGRPQKAIYTFNGENIAQIEFVFEVNAFNFMQRRIEKLSYFKKSDELSETWVIADDKFDMANPYHLREMMKERSDSRALIIEEVKAFLNGVLAQYYLPQGKTYPEILEIAGQFWAVYGNPIDSWISVGSPQFENMLTADTEFAFLSVPISATATVRSYILDKTSY